MRFHCLNLQRSSDLSALLSCHDLLPLACCPFVVFGDVSGNQSCNCTAMKVEAAAMSDLLPLIEILLHLLLRFIHRQSFTGMFRKTTHPGA